MSNSLDWLTDPDYAKKREASVSKIPGLRQAAEAAATTQELAPSNMGFDSETGQYINYGSWDWIDVKDPAVESAYIDKALEDPTKWVASNLNWSGLGDGGNFSALDDQIKYLKDNKYDLNTLDKRGLTHYNLTKQIIGQGTTGRWSGAGFGGPVENAKHMASTLMTAGIEDIKDFGQFKKKTLLNNMPVQQEMTYDSTTDLYIPTGKYYYSDEYTDKSYIDPKYVRQTQAYDTDGNYAGIAYIADNVPVGTQDVFGNKKTQQAITQDYNQAYGNIFSGTYAGHGRTNFGVQFAADGTPYFYTQFGGDTSDMSDIAPILSVLSIVPSPLQPFAAAANAIMAIDNGNTLGGLAALAGIPGVSEAASAAGLANVASGIQTANQVVNFVNAVESGNALGAITSGANIAGISGGVQDAANVVKALESGDPLSILSSGAKATGLLSTAITDGGMTVGDALNAANVVKAIESGDPNAIVKAAVGLTKSPTFKTSVNTPNTPVNSAGEKIAETVGENFVADLVNPDSPNFLGVADNKLSEMVSQPGAQLASTDNDVALQVLNNLQNQNTENQDFVSILGGTDSSADTPTDEPKSVQKDASVQLEPTTTPEQNVVVIPGEDGSQFVVDQNGSVVDIIPPADVTAPETVTPPSSEYQGPMGPMTEDKVKRYNEEFAKYLDYLQAGEPPPPDYGGEPLGMTGEHWDEFDKNLKTMLDEGRLPTQWQVDSEGNYTYVDDDGSTLTIGPDGQVVHYTEAPQGNLPGETPAPAPAPPATKPPAVQTPATQTPATQPPSVSTAPAAQSGMDVNALMAMLAMMGGTPAPAPAPEVFYSKMPEFDVTKAFSPTLYQEREKVSNPYLRGLTEEDQNG